MNGRNSGIASVSGGGAPSAAQANSSAIGRGERVPVLLDFLDRDLERLRERGLGEPRRNADAHRAGRQLDQRVAAVGVEPVEQRAAARSSPTARVILLKQINSFD